MSLPDTAMALYWRLVTDVDAAELARVSASLADAAVNPMSVKKQLGQRIVRMYHGAAAADQAQRDFETQFSKRATPKHLEEFSLAALKAVTREGATPTIIDFLMAAGMCDSRSAARRLVDQRAVRMNDQIVEAWDQAVDSARESVLRAGRKMKRYRPA